MFRVTNFWKSFVEEGKQIVKKTTGTVQSRNTAFDLNASTIGETKTHLHTQTFTHTHTTTHTHTHGDI